MLCLSLLNSFVDVGLERNRGGCWKASCLVEQVGQGGWGGAFRVMSKRPETVSLNAVSSS